MCPNRVEELESRVQELQASVEGLTDELVECKVRLRELENAVDEDLGFEPVSESEPGFEDPEQRAETADTADTPKSQGSEGEDNAAESEGDGIIVA